LFPEPVTPLTLALAVEAAYGLRGPSRAAACILTYRRLPERLQRGYDAAARREGHASGAIVA
jgi:hypothetical protein